MNIGNVDKFRSSDLNWTFCPYINISASGDVLVGECGVSGCRLSGRQPRQEFRGAVCSSPRPAGAEQQCSSRTGAGFYRAR